MNETVTGRSIAKNTTFYITALTLQKGLSFVYFTLVARTLGADLTGKYFFALSLAGIVIGIIDIGLTPVLTREVAKDRTKALSILGHTLIMKSILGFVMLAGGVIASPWIASDPLQRQLLYIALAIAMVDTITLSLFATVRAHQNLWYESVSAVAFQLVVFALGTIALFQGADVRFVMGALLIGSIVNCAIGYAATVKMLARVSGRFRFDASLMKRLLYLALPFALATVCIKANAYTDTVLVKLLLNDTAVGLYSVAYKITFAFQFIPMAFVASLYPAFAHLWQIDRQKLSVIFVQASTYLLVLSVPIVALVVATGDIVIPLVYRSEYRDSVMPLIVLMLSLPMLFINFPIGSLLNAIGRQTRQTVHLAIGVVATVGLNVVLIPLFGIVGAAIASLGSTVTVFTLGIIVAHRTVAFDAVQFIATSLWVVSAGALLFVSTIALRYVMPWYGAAVLGSVLYVTLLFVTDILNRRTLQQMRSLVRRSI